MHARLGWECEIAMLEQIRQGLFQRSKAMQSQQSKPTFSPGLCRLPGE